MSVAMLRLRSQFARTRQKILQSGDSPWLFKKTVLRSAGGILALFSFSFFAAAIVPWDQTFVHTSSSVKGDWQDGIPIGPLVLAFLYNIGTTGYVFYTARAVHSTIELVIDFLVWAALVPGLMLSIWGGTFRLWQGATVSFGMVECDSGTNALSKECFPELYHIGFLELAGIVFAIPVWILHVFLFTHKIVEKYSKSRRLGQRRLERIKEIELDMENNSWRDQSGVPPPPPPQSYARAQRFEPPPVPPYPPYPPQRAMPSAYYV